MDAVARATFATKEMASISHVPSTFLMRITGGYISDGSVNFLTARNARTREKRSLLDVRERGSSSWSQILNEKAAKVSNVEKGAN